MSPSRRARMLVPVALLAVAAGGGCSLVPKAFRPLKEPAPVNRARSIGEADNLPVRQAIPVLIGHLSDPDPVVRMAAIEELRRETGQTFGYLAWGTESDRAEAVARWRAWWGSQAQTPTQTQTQTQTQAPTPSRRLSSPRSAFGRWR